LAQASAPCNPCLERILRRRKRSGRALLCSQVTSCWPATGPRHLFRPESACLRRHLSKRKDPGLNCRNHGDVQHPVHEHRPSVPLQDATADGKGRGSWEWYQDLHCEHGRGCPRNQATAAVCDKVLWQRLGSSINLHEQGRRGGAIHRSWGTSGGGLANFTG